MGRNGADLVQPRCNRYVSHSRMHPGADVPPGSISFQFPTTTTTGNGTTIEGKTVSLTSIITQTIQPFLVDPHATYATYSVQGVDAGLWYNGTTYLLLVVNLNETGTFTPWGEIGLEWVTNATTQVQQIFSVPEGANATGLRFGPGDIGIFTATPPMVE